MRIISIQNLFLLALIFLIFIAPALWNGFPLIFTDSLSYLASGVQLLAPVDRPIFYGLFTRISNSVIELWGIVFLQSALVIFLLWMLANSLFPDLSKKCVLLWVFVVGITTSVPWFVSQISADIFTSCLFLTMIVLALTCKQASAIKNAWLWVLIVLEVCMHSANLLIGMIVFFFIIAMAWQQSKSFDGIKKFTFITTTALVISLVLIVASNAIFKQGATLNRWGKVIFLARILEDGPGLQYLNSVCAVKELKTCAALPLLNEAVKREDELGFTDNPELKNLVLNALLWDGGINASGGLTNVNDEALSIIQGSIKTYPWQMVKALVSNTFDQLRTFSVGNQFGSTANIEAINNFFESNFPENNKHYLSSAQYEGKVKDISRIFNVVYEFIILLSGFVIFTSIFYSFKKQRIDSSVKLVLFSLIIFLITNAMITGSISGIFDRYQSRVIWLLPAVSLLCAIAIYSRQNKKYLSNT